MEDREKYIDESLARSAMAERCDIPADRFREVLFEAKAACLIARVIDAYRTGGRLSLAYPQGYAELIELIEKALEWQDISEETEGLKNDQEHVKRGDC